MDESCVSADKTSRIQVFSHHFCLVRRPNEKGHTENLVGYSRRNFLVPVPEFEDFEVFNEGMADDCRRDLQRQLRGKEGTKAELLEEDRHCRHARSVWNQ